MKGRLVDIWLRTSHATSHIGAHLLSAFMRDRGNQLTLGTFIATFLYCLMLLRSRRSDPVYPLPVSGESRIFAAAG